jgi:hypothetical protein
VFAILKPRFIFFTNAPIVPEKKSCDQPGAPMQRFGDFIKNSADSGGYS